MMRIFTPQSSSLRRHLTHFGVAVNCASAHQSALALQFSTVVNNNGYSTHALFCSSLPSATTSTRFFAASPYAASRLTPRPRTPSSCFTSAASPSSETPIVKAHVMHAPNLSQNEDASTNSSSSSSSSNNSSDSSSSSSSSSSSGSSDSETNEKAQASGFFAFLRRMLANYTVLLERYPFRTQMATSGLLGGLGDATTQWCEHRWDRDEERMPKPWDLRRLFAFSFFGVYFMGPVGHVWYEKLDLFCHKYAKSKLAMIAIKVMGDTFVFGPICLWAFFVSVSLMEGISWRSTEQKIRRDFVPTYLVDYSFWPIVQSINFKYVPVQHQLMVVNLMCFLDDVFLSYVQHNSLPQIFQRIEDWWERVLKDNKWDTDLHELTALEDADDVHRKGLWKLHQLQLKASAGEQPAADLIVKLPESVASKS